MQKLLCAFVVTFVAAAAHAETVAKVGDRSISRAEVEAEVKPQLLELERQRYEILNNKLEEMIQGDLLEREAKARGISPEALFKTEVEAKVTAPTDEEVQEVYNQYQSQINGTFEQVKPQLTEYIRSQRAAAVQGELLAALREKFPVEVSLLPPVIEVGTGGRPIKGPENAPITIISFSDYECPFCHRAEETVAEVLKAYGDKVRFVHRDFPLAFHANAHAAAQSAHCAHEQGKFWEMHAKLFGAKDLSISGLKEIAKELGVDTVKFNYCLDSGQYKGAVDRDMAEGASVGVEGTPAFFINGRMLSGAQPFSEFKKIIDAELARLKL